MVVVVRVIGRQTAPPALRSGSQ